MPSPDKAFLVKLLVKPYCTVRNVNSPLQSFFSHGFVSGASYKP
jgi:hypothetical protein